MAIIAFAPPGEDPQAAVLPGRIWDLVRNQPTKPPAITELKTIPASTNQLFASTLKTSGVMLLATEQPTNACAQ